MLTLFTVDNFKANLEDLKQLHTFFKHLLTENPNKAILEEALNQINQLLLLFKQ